MELKVKFVLVQKNFKSTHTKCHQKAPEECVSGKKICLDFRSFYSRINLLLFSTKSLKYPHIINMRAIY